MDFMDFERTASGRPVITDTDVYKWKCSVRAIPLDASYIPDGGAPLEDLSDDALLSMPPHLICHVQRTAAQGGLQVVSPRQTPFSSLMNRISRPERDIGDHIVGSTAHNVDGWPLLEPEDLSHLLPDQPLSAATADHALRLKTKTESLTTSNRVLTDPILSCLVKGRACIDVLRRDDVNGGAEELAILLANAWGITRSEMDDMDAFTLGVTGSLLRHCIKADEVYPTLYAPIQFKRCIGVGVSQVTKEVLPLDCAMDWRRLRVFCEAVFYLSITIEGIPIHRIVARPPPGDPTAPGNRPGVLCFTPAPATSWTHAPSTFCITPLLPKDGGKGAGIPNEVYTALSKYIHVARPMLKAESLAITTRARKTTVKTVDMPDGETLSSGYSLMTRTLLVGSVRGKLSCSAVRNALYKALESAPLDLRMRLARYISIAQKECKIHLKADVVPDLVIDRIAGKFRILGEYLRLKIAEEATKRGQTIARWWSDVMAQVPDRFMEFEEGTAGWTKIGLWLTFRGNSHKWVALTKAMEFSALREAEANAVGEVSLPPIYGSKDRIEAVGRGAVKNISRVYAAYYRGVSDVGLAISDVLEQENKTRSASRVRDASYLWELRGRALRGTNFYVIAKTEPTKSRNHKRFDFGEVDAIMAPSPYRAFETYKNHVAISDLPNDYKMHVASFEETKQSECFRTYTRPIVGFAESLLTRYLVRPWELANDLERGWGELAGDIRVSVKAHAMKRELKLADTPVFIPGLNLNFQLPVAKVGGKKDYFALLADFDLEQVEYIEDKLEAMTPEDQERITRGEYEDETELLQLIWAFDDPRERKYKKAKEAVN